VGSSCML